MFDLKLPSDGLTVLHNRPSSQGAAKRELPQVLQLDLSDILAKDVLKSIRNNEQVRLKLGKKPIVQYGKKHLDLSHARNTFPSEIFSGPTDGSEPIYFSGKLSHTLEIQKAKQATAKADEALAALENNLKSIKEQQASNGASFVGGKAELMKKDIRTAPLNNRDRLRGTTTPSSPFLGASPRLGSSSSSLLSLVPSKEKIRQDAMRIPIVHLLAMSPLNPKAISRKLNASQADCDKVLDKVAKDGHGGVKELKEKCFKELDVWKFPYQTEEDRKAAIEHAIHAYDRMRIEKTDQLWQLLLPKEERGKNKFLSRLNFERPPPAAATPKLGMDNDGKADVSDREVKVKKTGVNTDSKDLSHKSRLSGDTTIRKKTEKVPTRPATQPSKSESKFKSSERVEDSDEEAKGVEVVPAKPKVSKFREKEVKATPIPKKTSIAQTNGQDRLKVANPSTESRDLDRSRHQEDRKKLTPRPQSERSPSTSRISPRPRVNSSPQKPSPLGSSPPTNSTDLENSSKSSTQSSAPSSPPSSTDMPLSQARKTYSPVITGKGRNVPNPPKRKAEKGEEPSAKRQQVHGLGLPKTLTERLQQPTPERRSSASSLSSPEKHAPTKESVLDVTLDFREYYNKYEALHAKLNRIEPDERSDRELDKLWRMHERLEKLKAELWADWAKAGGE